MQKKYAAIEAAEVSYDAYMTDDAEIVIAAYGVCSRIARTVVDLARKQGRKVGLFRPRTLFPFPKNELKALARTAQKFICVELSNGQFCDDVKLAIECSRPVALVGKMGGNLVTQEEIMAAL